MNLAICNNTWTEGMNTKLRMIILTMFFLFPLVGRTLQLCSTKEFPNDLISAPSIAVFFVLIWGCGTIGRHVQDGTLALVLSRPVTITEFVTSKWLAVAIASSVVSLLQLLAEAIVVRSWIPTFDFTDVWFNGVDRLMICFGFSSFLMLLSSIVNGSKDLALYLLAIFLHSISQYVSQLDSSETKQQYLKMLIDVAARCGDWLETIFKKFLEPHVAWHYWMAQSVIPWYDITFYLTVIAASLSLAILALNRKELPYGSA